MRPIIHFIKHPKDILLGVMTHTASLWPDSTYLRIVYYLHMGKRLNLKNPKTYTEKINWLKINDVHPEYSKFVDKYEVKSYVNERLGTDRHTIKTLGVWDSFDDIDFDGLPEKFVLKTTNGGGNTAVVICRDKTALNIENARKKLCLCKCDKSFKWSREYTYLNVEPRIIAEEYIETPDNELSDYKIFCFDGVPRFLFVGTERQKAGVDVKFDFYDVDFKHLPIKNMHENAAIPPAKPKNFELMLEIASKLSRGIKHVRVDLYNVDGKIYFGEMTFFHFAGLVPFEPEEWDYKFGEYLKLDK